MPRRQSLTARLLTAALVWLAAAWAVGAVALDHAFREAQAERFRAKLEVLVRHVAAALIVDETGTAGLAPLGMRSFIEGDWYWQVKLDDGRVLRSPSLGDRMLRQMLDVAPGEVQYGCYDDGPFGGAVVTAQTAVVLPGRTAPAYVKVAVADADMGAAVQRFRTILGTASVFMGLGLALAIVLQIRWGLWPVRRLMADLERVKRGEGGRLSEDVPTELAPLVATFNDVLDHDRRTVERARGLAGSLAHALKTEIALLRTEIAEADPPLRARLAARAQRLAELVDRHLGRGGLVSAAAIGAHAVTDTRAAIEELAAMLRTVHAARELDLSVVAEGAPNFRGDRQDFVEMVGNLLDNACKHARTTVRVSAWENRGRLAARVEDDGPGLPEDQRDAVLERGRRLDERMPGSGLGLAIVTDLVEGYGGTLRLEDSALGGLAAVLDLPAVATADRSEKGRPPPVPDDQPHRGNRAAEARKVRQPVSHRAQGA